MLVLFQKGGDCHRYVHSMQEYGSGFMYEKALAEGIEAYIKIG
jgi:hypothetical protein